MSEIKTGCNDNCPYYYENTGCFKPEGSFCPPMSTTINCEIPCSDYDYTIMDNIPKTVRNCIICGNATSSAEEMVCDDCREAILWAKKKLLLAYLNKGSD